MISVSVGALLQHLLFLVLAVVAPLWDFYDTSRLKKNPSLAGKLRYYKTLAAWLWIASAIAVVTVGFRTLTTINPAPDEISWLLQHAWVGHLAEALIAIILVVLLLLPLTIVIWKKLTKQPRRYRSADALKSFDYFFPATWTERRWFAFLCITAGICEEALFRGFLLPYLHVSAFSLNLTLALLISSIIFGLNHLYGGVGGVVGSAVVGFFLGLLFILTGNLLLPMVLHALFDLRMLVILRPPSAMEAVPA
jgi:membrane protease YdiL (CAAX protease family)